MPPSESARRNVEETPVDDVRRVREKMSEEAGNDLRVVAERTREIAERLREELGLRRDESSV